MLNFGDEHLEQLILDGIVEFAGLDKNGEISEEGIFCRSEKIADDLIKRFEHRDNIRKVDSPREKEELPMDTEGSSEISE